MRIIRLDDPTELAAYEAPTGWQTLSREEVARHAPQRSLIATRDGALVARCSLWWSDVPALAGERLGAIGHYGAVDRVAALALLEAACAELAKEGRTRAVGPMDGNTWRRYRLVVEHGSEPPFFLEPENPPESPTHFSDAGFSPLAWYLSALNEDLGRRDPRAAAVVDRLTDAGVSVRELDLARFDEELARIHRVAAVAFQDAFLYTPLSEEMFAAQYRAIRPVVRPELVLLAERDGEPVGFSFSVPDMLEAARGAPPRTVVFKTLAVLPDRRAYSGLGSLMADRTHQIARSLGYTRVIHGLIHESNHSRAMSERTGRTIRRYALFSRVLTT